MENKDLLSKIPSLDTSQVLTDEMMSTIESGACDNGCKKQCITNMNGSTGGSSDAVKVAEKVLDAAVEAVK